MSNPAVYLLHQNKVHGNVLRIEDNLGEAIHIHYGDSRFSITVEEFEKMCEAIEMAAKDLFELEGFDWDAIDKSSLDWNWLCQYENIDKISLKQVKLGDLYTKKNIYKGDGFQRTIKLEDSMFVEELTSKSSDIDKYVECNMFGQNNRDRLSNMYTKIMESDYPFDGKYIAVSGENIIYDGDHRAACLYVKHGADYEIPVIELKFKNHKSIDEQLKEENKKYKKFLIKTFLKAVKRRIKWVLKSIVKGAGPRDITIDGNAKIEMSKVYEWLRINQCKYYFIGENTLIVDDIASFKNAFKDSCTKAYDGFKLLYSINNPLRLNTDSGEYMVWDTLCCKSRFENSLLPLDKFCNEYAWNTRMRDAKGIDRASIEVEIIYAITTALLEKMSFTDSEKKMIQDNIRVFEDNDFMTMLDKEFFGYKKQIKELLVQNKFDECISGYITNTEY